MGRGMSAEVRRATRGEALNGWLDERTDHDGCLDLKKRNEHTLNRTSSRPGCSFARSLARSQTDFARTFDDEQ